MLKLNSSEILQTINMFDRQLSGDGGDDAHPVLAGDGDDCAHSDDTSLL